MIVGSVVAQVLVHLEEFLGLALQHTHVNGPRLPFHLIEIDAFIQLVDADDINLMIAMIVVPVSKLGKPVLLYQQISEIFFKNLSLIHI